MEETVHLHPVLLQAAAKDQLVLLVVPVELFLLVLAVQAVQVAPAMAQAETGMQVVVVVQADITAQAAPVDIMVLQQYIKH
jgi:hypothetical protein